MNEKKQASDRRPAGEKPERQGRTSLDHGADALVAQDSPDDSQLGAPDRAGRARNTPTQ